jgi:hypothetical protein
MMILNDDNNPTDADTDRNGKRGRRLLDAGHAFSNPACGFSVPFCCPSPERGCWMLDVGYYLLWKRLWD